MSVVIPEHQLPGRDTTLGNHEKRIRALERQKPFRASDDIDFRATYIDVWAQDVSVPGSSPPTNVDWTGSTPGQTTMHTNDRGFGAETITPVSASLAFTGTCFQVDFSGDPGEGLGPTNIKIIAPGVYWVRVGAISFDTVTANFTLDVTQGGAQFAVGGTFGFLNVAVFPLAVPASEDGRMFVWTTDVIAGGVWRGCEISHDSSDMATASAELTIIRVAPLPDDE